MFFKTWHLERAVYGLLVWLTVGVQWHFHQDWKRLVSDGLLAMMMLHGAAINSIMSRLNEKRDFYKKLAEPMVPKFDVAAHQIFDTVECIGSLDNSKRWLQITTFLFGIWISFTSGWVSYLTLLQLLHDGFFYARWRRYRRTIKPLTLEAIHADVPADRNAHTTASRESR